MWRPRYVQELDYERELKHLVECHDAIMPRYARNLVSQVYSVHVHQLAIYLYTWRLTSWVYMLYT